MGITVGLVHFYLVVCSSVCVSIRLAIPPLQPEFVIIDAYCICTSKHAEHDVDERSARRDANHLVDLLPPNLT
jgi:hypothetical protein